MPAASEIPDSESHSPSEHSPLLGGQVKPTDNGTIEREAGEEEVSQDETPIPEEPSNAKLLLIMGSLYFNVFFAALDSTIIATLTTPISASFDSFTLLSWLASGYLIANAGFQPLSGKLTDIYGRNAGLIFANTFFAAGTLICGLAQKEWVIILGRVVAGMGGGCLNTIGVFIASDLIPLRRRGLWQGFANIAFGTGTGVGGIFGGWINDRWGWRWAFLVQVPLIVISGTIVFFTVDIPVKETDKSKIKRVDFLGAITLVSTLVLLLLGLNSGGNVVPWNHPLIYVSLPLSGVFLLLFIYIEEKVASEPVIPVRLLLNRTVAASCLTNWFASMGFYAFLFYVPVYFQVRGLSAAAAGGRILPAAIGTSVGSLGAGIIMRATGRYYVQNACFQALIVIASSVMVAMLDLNTATWPPFVVFPLLGIGFGGMLTVTLLALISAVDHKYQAVATSASYAFRATGSTIGITIASAVFQNTLTSRLWERLGDRDGAGKVISRVRDSIDQVKYLPADWKFDVLESYMDAFRGVWIVILVMCVLSAGTSLFMREHVLHSNIARK